MLGAIKILVVVAFVGVIMVVVILLFTFNYMRHKKAVQKRILAKKQLCDGQSCWNLAEHLEKLPGVFSEHELQQCRVRAFKQGFAPALEFFAGKPDPSSDTDFFGKEWFEFVSKVAQHNLNEGFYQQGRCYEDGKGVEHNMSKAIECWKTAANLRDPLSQWSLGVCYEHGLGTSKDLVQAYVWLSLSAKSFKPAENDRYDLAFMLDKSQHQEANRLIEQKNLMTPGESSANEAIQTV
ncbi:MAG: sel1 repeat family protein [SAR324 cluster bacterium]|nr:sel1 repeat family protein [SAR324 cluster bacterium]